MRVAAADDAMSNAAESPGPAVRDVEPATSSAASNLARSNLEVSARSFRAYWIVITGYHIFNAAFLATIAWSHLYTARDEVYENVWLIQISQPMLRNAGRSYALLSGLHWLTVFVNIGQSVRRGRLSFGYDVCDEIRLTSKSREASRTRHLYQRLHAVFPAVLDLWEKYFGMHGLFGVHGAFFYIGFYLRQTAEIVLQTYQAYMISRSLPTLWINQFVVSMIVINCLYTPVLSTIFRKRAALRRVLNLTFDIMLDFAIVVVVPIVSFAPSLKPYDWKTHAYPLELVFNDVWITTNIMMARQTLVNSSIDYISSMFPHLAGLVGLDTIKRIVQRRSAHTERKATKSASQLQKMLKRMRQGVNSVSPSNFRVMLTSSRTIYDDEQRHRRVTWAFHAFTVAGAAAVVTLHLASHKSAASLASCELSVSSWLTEKASCAVANINCYRLGLTGARDEMASILNNFQRPALSRVVFSHCPALHIPDEVNLFPNLIGLATFNSTLVDWPASGAVTKKLTPNLLTINFVDTNFTASLPSGVLHRELPTNVALAIYRSNLTELPRSIGVDWYLHVFPTLVIEYTNLRELPDSFQHVLAYRLSLGRNQLRALPEGVLRYQTIQRLRLSGNPLVRLPESMGSAAVLSRVWFEETNVSEVPPFWTQWWAAAKASGAPDVSFSLHGSPLCDDAAAAALDYCEPAPAQWRDEFPYDAIAAQYRLK